MKDEKNQQGVGRVKKEIGEMMARRSAAPKFKVEHSRERRDWLPVVGMGGVKDEIGFERPTKALPGEASNQVRVLVNINAIIKIDKIKIENLAECCQNGQEDDKSEQSS